MKNLIKYPKQTLETNVVYCADNLEVMKQLPPESIDLIYIDPPFGTNSLRKSKTWDQQIQNLSFYDSATSGIKTYVSFMVDRLEQMHRLLKNTGSIYVHLDYRAVHYIKCKMDEIFGTKNFINEIIWSYRTGGNNPKKSFSKKHDTILMYAKGNNYIFNNIEKEKVYLSHKYGFKTIKTYKKIIEDCKAKIKCFKPFKYSSLRDVWEIQALVGKERGSNINKERIGWPTQKPLALLERIIKASSNEGDIVADFFCGCGTTLSAAQKLNRKWLGVDAHTEASKTIRKRMARDHNIKIDITSLKNLKKSEVLKLQPFEFEQYCVRCIGGIPHDRKVRPGGINGKLIKDGTPIQVKKSQKIDRAVIDAFHKHFRRNGRGIIIALSFSKDAKEESHRLKVDEGKDLKLITLDSLLTSGPWAA